MIFLSEISDRYKSNTEGCFSQIRLKILSFTLQQISIKNAPLCSYKFTKHSLYKVSNLKPAGTVMNKEMKPKVIRNYIEQCSKTYNEQKLSQIMVEAPLLSLSSLTPQKMLNCHLYYAEKYIKN